MRSISLGFFDHMPRKSIIEAVWFLISCVKKFSDFH